MLDRYSTWNRKTTTVSSLYCLCNRSVRYVCVWLYRCTVTCRTFFRSTHTHTHTHTYTRARARARAGGKCDVLHNRQFWLFWLFWMLNLGLLEDTEFTKRASSDTHCMLWIKNLYLQNSLMHFAAQYPPGALRFLLYYIFIYNLHGFVRTSLLEIDA
jgi:hypothetical protein